MPRKMLIDASHPEETRVVVVDGQRVDQFDFETITKKQISGNVYLARVTRVEPSLQAAFIEYGGNKHGFLPFSEIHPDYYQIPHADRAALLADAARAYQQEEEEERPNRGGRGGNRGRDGAGGAQNGGGQNGGRGRSGRDAAEAEARPAPEAAKDGEQDRPDSRGARNDRRQRGRGRGRDRRRGESRVGWIEVLEREVLLEDGGTAQLYRLERRAPAVEEAEAPEAPESPGAPAAEVREEVVREIELEDGTTARLIAPQIGRRSGQRRGKARPMAASPDDSASGEASSGRRARFLRRRRRPNDKRGEDRKGDSRDQAAAAGPGDEAEETGRILDSAEETEIGAPLQGEILDAAESEGFEIEEAGSGDSHEEAEAAPRRFPRGRYKIQEVIKKRQILLVQVVKEERGNKGAALTTYVSLAGRYCVLMPNTARGGGISRKITEAADRKRLKEAAEELDVPKGMGLIVRTAGADRTKAEIKRDYDYLIRQWTSIRDLTLASIAPKLVYEEGDLIKRTIRDLYSKDIDELLVEGEDGYREAKDFMKMLTPSHAKNVKLYRDDVPLFIRHQVESQLTAMFNPVVQLRSGGYIVINVTEALVAIDVNSGRSTREHSIEDTALKTNLEAAEEAARQMRLRDLAGLLVIDFIDMDDPRNDRAVERRLKDALKTDRARMQIGRISNFGLLEMSRQRLRPGMLEASTKPCPHCQGVGHVRSDESLALSILREAEEAGVREPGVGMRIVAPVSIANYLINHKRERLLSLEKRYRLAAHVDGDPTLAPSEHRLERFLLETVARAEGGPIAVDSGLSDAEEVEEEIREEIQEAAEAPEAPAAAAESRPAPQERGRGERDRERGGRSRAPRRIEIEEARAAPEPREAAPEAGRADPLPVIDLKEEGAAESILAPEFPASGEGREKRDGRRGRGGRGRDRESRRERREEAPQEASAPAAAEPAPEEAAPAAPAALADGDLGGAATDLLSRPDALDLAAAQVFAEPAPAARAEPAAPVVVETPADPVSEPAPAAEAAPEPTPAAPEPEAPKPDRPKRSGWWSRG